MNAPIHPRLEMTAIWKEVREQTRDSIYKRFAERLDRFEALLREIEGKKPKRKKSAKVIRLSAHR
jgi:hypothetical protein